MYWIFLKWGLGLEICSAGMDILCGGQVEWVETTFIAISYKTVLSKHVLSQIMWKAGFPEKLFCESITTRIPF